MNRPLQGARTVVSFAGRGRRRAVFERMMGRGAGVLAVLVSFCMAESELRATTISPATNDYSNYSTTGGGLDIVMTPDTWNSNVTLFGTISGFGGVSINGAAPVTLAGSNSWIGSLALNGGALKFSSDGNLGNASNVLAFNGGTLQSLNDVSSARLITIGTGSSQFYNGSSFVTRTGATLGGTGRMVLSGNITGSGPLNKIDSGTLLLSGANNTFSGGTYITAGTVEIGADNALGSGAITITGGGIRASGAARTLTNALVFNGTFTLGRLTTLSGDATLTGNSVIVSGNPDSSAASSSTLSGIISGNYSLGFDVGSNPTGNIIVSGANTYTGGTTISAGRITMGNAAALSTTGGVSISSGATLDASTYGFNLNRLSGAGTITSSGSYTISPASNASLATILAGAAALTKTGSATLTLNGANTYSGGTTISAGQITMGNATALGTTGTVSIAGGATLDAAGYGFDIGRVSGGGTITTTGGYTATNASDLTVATKLSGSTALAKAGVGNLILSGANDYSGGTTISAGRITMGSSSAVGTTGTVSVAGGATLDASTYGFNLSRLSGAGTVTSSGGYTTTSADASVATVLSGTSALSKTGAGNLTLSGASTYTGGTTISAGKITLGNAAGVGTTGTVNVGSGATLDASTYGFNLSRLTGPGTVTSSGGYTSSGGDLILTNSLQGTASLTKSGTGTLNLGGTNTYSGGTFISGGMLELGSGSSVGSGTITLTGGGIRAAGDSRTLTNAMVFNGTFTLGRATNLSGNVTLAGDSTIISSNPDAGAGASFLGGIISGDHSLSFTEGANPNGNIFLSGANTYTGGTTISAGRITMGNAAGLGTTGTVSISSGATLDASSYGFDLTRISGTGTITSSGAYTVSSADLVTRQIVLAGTASFVKTGAGIAFLYGASTYSGGTTISEGQVWMANASALGTGPVSIAGGATLDAYYYGFDLSRISGAGTLSSSGVYSYNSATDMTLATILASDGSLVKSGSSNLTLSGASSYTGDTTISGGKITMANSSALGTWGRVRIDSGATLDASTYGFDLGRLSEAGTGTLTSSGDYTYAAEADASLATILAGSASLIKTGGNHLTLSGANTYSGATTISGGTITMGNASALSTTMVKVASGATLDAASYGFDLYRLIADTGTVSTSGTFGATSSGDATVTNILAGTGSLAKSGGGVLTLTRANTYSRGTSISAGLVQVGNNTALGSGTITLTGGGIRAVDAVITMTNALVLNGTITLGRYTNLNGNATLAGDTTIVSTNPDAGGGSSGLGGIISGNHSLSFTEGANPDGNIILSGANTYTGGTTISAGKITMGHANALGTTGMVNVASGATLDASTYGFNIDRLSGSGSILSSGSYTSSSSDDASLDVLLAGTDATFTKSGSGVLTLTRANTYRGTTYLYGGMLKLGADDAIPLLNTIVISGGGIGASGAARLLKNNLYVNGDFTLGGYLTFSGNTMTLTGDSTIISSNPDAISAGTSALNDIEGNHSLTFTEGVNPNGNIILNGRGNYTGGTIIASGRVTTQREDAFGSGPIRVDAGGTLDMQFRALDISNVSGAGRVSATLGSNLSIGPSADTTYAMILEGTGSLTKNGASTVTLTGVSTYTGGTIINAGKVVLGNASALGTTGSVQVASGTTLDASTFGFNIDRLTGTGTVTTSGVFSTNSYATVNALLTGTGSLNKWDTGTVAIMGANTYSGGTTISAGRVELGDENALGTGTVTMTGGGIRAIGLPRTIANDFIFNGTFALGRVTTLSGNVTLAGDTTIVSTNPDVGLASQSELSGIISGDYSLTFTEMSNPIGNILISGVNTYTGGTIISSGRVTMGNDAAFGTGSIRVDGNGLLDVLARDFDPTRVTGGGPIASSGRYLVSNALDITETNILSGTASLTKSGIGNLTLTGGSVYTGGTTISAGKITMGNDRALGTTGTISISSGAILDASSYALDIGRVTGAGSLTSSGSYTISPTSDAIFSMPLAGTASLIKGGAYNLTLTGLNTYSGGTTISAGRITMGSASAVGTSGAVSVSSGATLDAAAYGFDLDRLAGSGTITSAGGYTASTATSLATKLSGAASLTKSGTGDLLLSGTNDYTGGTMISGGKITMGNASAMSTTGTVNVASGATLDAAAYGFDLARLTGTGTVTSSGNYTASADSDSSVNSVLDGTAALIKSGTGRLALTRENTYDGGTFINGGLVSFDAIGNFGSGSITLNGGGLQWATGNTSDISSYLDGLGDDGALLDVNGNDVTLAHGLTGGGALNVSGGAGTLTLTALNTYSGGTVIFNGTLAVDNDGVNTFGRLGEGDVTIQSTATLKFLTNSNANTLVKVFRNKGSANTSEGGVTEFHATSTALYTDITNEAGTAPDGLGGRTKFFDTATAGNATVKNEGSQAIGAGHGATEFSDDANALLATITNHGGLASGGRGGSTIFSNTSRAGRALINNNGGQLGNALGGVTQFLDNSTADESRIIASGGTASGATGGQVRFLGDSTADHATLEAYGSSGVLSGGIYFLEDSTGGQAKVKVSGTGVLDISSHNAGSVTIGSLEGGGIVLLGANGLVVGSNDVDTTFSGTMQDGGLSGTFTKSGDGTLTLTGVSTYGGGTTITGGLVNFSEGENFGTGDITLNGGGLQWVFGSTVDISDRLVLGDFGGTLDLFFNSITLASAISGPGSLEASGGELTLTGDNTYSGATVMSGNSVLQIGNGGTTGSVAGDISVDALLIFNRSDAVTYSHVISGLGGLTKSGAGALTLTGENTYEMGTTILGGLLQIGNGGTTGSVRGDIVNDGSLAFNRSDDVTFADVISGSGGLTKSGAGILTLTRTNTYGGGTSIRGGLIKFATNANLGTGDITLDGGGLEWATGNTIDISSRLTAFGNGGAVLDVNDNDVTLASVLSGTGGLTKRGTGKLTLTGSNSYAGTTLQEGTLQIGDDSFAGGATGSIAGDVVNDGALVINRSGDLIYTGSISGAGSLTKSGDGTLTLSGASTYSGGTTINMGTTDTSMVVFSSAANFGTGPITINGAGLRWAEGNTDDISSRIAAINAGTNGDGVTSNYSNPSVIFDTNGNDITFANGLTGTAGLRKQGAGTLRLQAANTYTGATSIEAGVLAIGAGGLVANTGVRISDGATLDLGGSTQTLSSLTSNGSVVGAGTLNMSGSVSLQGAGTYENNWTGTGTPLAIVNATVRLNGSNDIVDAFTNMSADIFNSTVTLGDVNALAAADQDARIYLGTIDLNGLANVRGRSLILATQRSGTGAINLINGDAAHAASFGGGIQITNIYGATDNGPLFGGEGDLLLSGIISDATNPTGISKIGAGTLTLSGNNTYRGGTIIETGTLIVQNSQSLGAGQVHVTGGTLMISANVTALSNGVLLEGGSYKRALGAEADLANAVDATSHFAGGNADTTASILQGELSDAGELETSFRATSLALNDGIRKSDIYSLHGTGSNIIVLQLTVSGVTEDSYLGWLDPESDTWVNAVLGNTNGPAYFVGNRAYNSSTDFHLGFYGVDTATGSVWAVVDHNSDFSSVPEPSTWALIALGLGAVLWRARRRVA